MRPLFPMSVPRAEAAIISPVHCTRLQKGIRATELTIAVERMIPAHPYQLQACNQKPQSAPLPTHLNGARCVVKVFETKLASSNDG